MEWLISFPIINLMRMPIIFKKIKNLMNLIECYQHILNKI